MIIHTVSRVKAESDLGKMNYVFMEWLDSELAKPERHWSHYELSQRAGISHGAISHIYRGRRKPGIDVCNAIADALQIPRTIVQEKAGLLPTNPKRDILTDEILFVARQLTEEDKEDLLTLARAKSRRNAERRSHGPASNDCGESKPNS